MGKRGPKPGSPQVGGVKEGSPGTTRHKINIPEMDWVRVEVLAEKFSPISEIAESIKVSQKVLAKRIEQRYNMTAQDFLDFKQGSGKSKFRESLYNMACDGKHPIVSIFCAKNWLGMMDEKTPPKPPDNSQITNKFLTSLTTILNKLTDKTTKLPELEVENKVVEDAIYTDITPDNNVLTNQPNNIIHLPIKHNIIEHSSTVEQDNNIVRETVQGQAGAE